MISLREQVERYLARGWSACRIAPGEKRPTYKGWNTRAIPSTAFDEGDNVGLITGPLSGGLVCVDIDCVEALATADELLPQTDMIDGRTGKPASHWWYVCRNVDPRFGSRIAWRGPTGGIDFLLTRSQAVVPPSVHASGERREWVGGVLGEPAVVDFASLLTGVVALGERCNLKLGAEKLKLIYGAVSPVASTPVASTPVASTPVASTPVASTPVASTPVASADDPRWPPMAVRAARAREYVSHLPAAVSGQGGSDLTLRLVRLLWNDFALSDAAAWPILVEFNARCSPPWSDAELRHKVSSATVSSKTYPRGCKLGETEPFNDPHRLARTFLADMTWRTYHGQYYMYAETRYVGHDLVELRARVTKHVKAQFDHHHADLVATAKRKYEARAADGEAIAWELPKCPPVRRSLVTDVISAIESETLVPSWFTMPCELPTGGVPFRLACQNGLLDVSTRTLHAHTPNWFDVSVLPYPFVPGATCPTWLRCLERSQPDPDVRDLLQQWCGYLLAPHVHAQTCLVTFGSGSNGKSVFNEVVRSFLGRSNYSTTPLERFGERFALAATVGKLANIVDEVNDLDRVDEGRIKAFVSQDMIEVESKYHDAYSVRPTARLMVACNNPPRINDRSDGFRRRLRLVPFLTKVDAREADVALTSGAFWTASGELPGVLNWALDGLAKLQANGWRLPHPVACERALEAHWLSSNYTLRFLRDEYITDPSGRVFTQDVYRAYRNWCADEGHARPLSAPEFGKVVMAAFPSVRRDRARTPQGKRAWAYSGIREIRSDDSDLAADAEQYEPARPCDNRPGDAIDPGPPSGRFAAILGSFGH